MAGGSKQKGGGESGVRTAAQLKKEAKKKESCRGWPVVEGETYLPLKARMVRPETERLKFGCNCIRVGGGRTPHRPEKREGILEKMEGKLG